MTHSLMAPERWSGRILAGEWQTTASGTIAVNEPATGAEIATVGRAGPADVAEAAALARAAQPAWAAWPPEARGKILYRAAALLDAHAAELAPWIMRESGSVRAKAMVELDHAAGFVTHAAAMASEPQGLVLPSSGGRLNLARRVPHGVVGVISPFNFPLVLSIRAVAPALAVGNAVVLKPDSRTTISGGVLIARLFEEAGLPAGLLTLVPGDAEVGEAICSDPHIAMVHFTGSTAAGRKVGEVAGRNLKKVSLELGGKNALIILDDADLDLAAANAAWGAYLHQGQICMATGRILVQDTIAEALIDRLAAKVRHLPAGDPMTDQVALGPIINEAQAARIDAIVAEAVAAGATLIGGGRDGLYYRPAVLTGVKPGMRAYDEEIFGPVAVVTTFATDDEAVTLANDTPYGLAGGVLSNSLSRALAIGDRLLVGQLHINDQTVAAEPWVPFGGRGASGNGGRVSGPANWEEFTQWQWLTVKGCPNAYPF